MQSASRARSCCVPVWVTCLIVLFVTLSCGSHHRFPGRERTEYEERTRGESCMLAKCANPSCFTSFRLLREGRLFRLEGDAALNSRDSPTFSGSNIVEYFWLCDPCSTLMTLRLDEKGTVAVEPLSERARDNPRFFAIISRHKGMLLRSVGTTYNAQGTSSPLGSEWQRRPSGRRR